MVLSTLYREGRIHEDRKIHEDHIRDSWLSIYTGKYVCEH